MKRHRIFSAALGGAVCAFAVAVSAFAAPVTYVVPAGTAGNVPEEPYDSWVKAANSPRVAADATDEGGMVYILGGDYSSYTRIAPEQNVHVRIVATQETDAAPGVMTTGNVLIGYKDPASGGTRKFQVDYGTVKLAQNSNAFLEYVTGGNWGMNCRAHLVVSGAQAKLDLTQAQTGHFGYSTLKNELTVTDGATLETPIFHVGSTTSAHGTKMTVANGARVVCSSSFRVGFDSNMSGNVLYDCMLTVSNATVTSGYQLMVGKKDYSRNNRVVTAGERPLIYATYDSFVYGTDSALVMNVAEAPLDGYAEVAAGSGTTRAVLRIAGSLTLTQGATFELVGVEALAERLQAAQRQWGSWLLIEGKSGSDLVFESDDLARINAQLAADGLENFRLEQNGAKLALVRKPSVVYVTPAGTAGNAPEAPYNSWTLAANSVKTGSQEVVTGGKVVIASGAYDQGGTTALNRTAFPDQCAVFRAVASETDPSPGTVTLANRGFASGYENRNPERYNVTFEYGTFTFAPNTSKQSFLEYTVTQSWGSDTRCRLTVAGEQTVFDNRDVTFYSGYTSKNSCLRFTDHAQGYFGNLYVGPLGGGSGASVLVDSGAVVTNSGAVTIGDDNATTGGSGGSNVGLTISNATLSAYRVQIGGNYVPTSGNWLRILDHGVYRQVNNNSFTTFASKSFNSGILFDNSAFDQPEVAFNFANPGTNNTLIVRNGAFVNVKSLTLGSAGAENGFVCEVGNAAIAVADACALDGDAKLKLDVAQVALDGTAPAFVSAKTLTVAGNAAVELAGAAELKARADAAEAESFKVTLLQATDGLDVPAAAVEALRAALPDGTALLQTPTALKLRVGTPKGLLLLVQ